MSPSTETTINVTFNLLLVTLLHKALLSNSESSYTKAFIVCLWCTSYCISSMERDLT